MTRPDRTPLPSLHELRVCTVLPTYNERDNIGPLIHGILHHARSRHQVVVVDDDSPDGTAAVVAELAARYNEPGHMLVHLEHRTQDRGLTSAIQRGIDLAIHDFHADVVTWMDCDLSMPPADVPRLIETLAAHDADLAVGSRWAPGGADVAHTRMAKSLSRLINLYASLVIGGPVRDFTSGFIAARAPILTALRLRGDYGEYCIDLLGAAIRRGYRVIEMPYVCVPRAQGESKTGANLWDYLAKGRKYVTAAWRQARFRR